MRTSKLITVSLFSCVSLAGCGDSAPIEYSDESSETAGDGDGDGDPATGDGDGDGDPATGDGDGDGDPTTGDGDGDPTTGDGDGDGDPTTGDGDGDGDGDPGAICGDGMVEGDEVCDDGNDDNTDDCLDTCVAASCGDGFVQANVDECDDGNDDNADGCLSTCVTATICSQILAEIPDAEDGVYTIDPDGAGDNAPFDAYCDMSNDDGGWTLVAKVHRWHMGNPYVEPDGWFAEALDLDALLDTVSYEDRPAAVASHGAMRLGPALPDMSVARFSLIAEDDVDQTATWFKAIDAEAFSWFSTTDHAATAVCEDPELMLNCTDGNILSTGWTPLQGMTLADYGYSTGCNAHMRMDPDDGSDFSAVCSCTQDLDNNAWNDDADDGHWGNGLEIWFR